MSRPYFTFYAQIRTPAVPHRVITVEVQARDVAEARMMIQSQYPAATFSVVLKNSQAKDIIPLKQPFQPGGSAQKSGPF